MVTERTEGTRAAERAEDLAKDVGLWREAVPHLWLVGSGVTGLSHLRPPIWGCRPPHTTDMAGSAGLACARRLGKHSGFSAGLSDRVLVTMSHELRGFPMRLARVDAIAGRRGPDLEQRKGREGEAAGSAAWLPAV